MRAYDRVDATFYDHYSTGLEGDAEFYAHQAVQAGGPVLELGCGTGRILVPVAQAGATVVGLDQSAAMLAIAKRKIAKLDDKTRRRITLVRGDMRTFSLRKRYALIMVPYRAFLHLLTPEDQRQALARIRHHLDDNGRLILNIFDPRLDIIAAHFGPLGSALKRDDEFVHPVTGNRVVVWDTRQYDPEQQLIDQTFVFEEMNANGRVISKTMSTYLLRYVYRYEMQYLLELAGFQVEALYGDFEQGPFHYGREQIWVARRA